MLASQLILPFHSSCYLGSPCASSRFDPSPDDDAITSSRSGPPSAEALEAGPFSPLPAPPGLSAPPSRPVTPPLRPVLRPSSAPNTPSARRRRDVFELDRSPHKRFRNNDGQALDVSRPVEGAAVARVGSNAPAISADEAPNHEGRAGRTFAETPGAKKARRQRAKKKAREEQARTDSSIRRVSSVVYRSSRTFADVRLPV